MSGPDPLAPDGVRRARRRTRKPGGKRLGGKHGRRHEFGSVANPTLSAAESQSLSRSGAELVAWPVLQQKNRGDGKYTMDLSDLPVQTSTPRQARSTLGAYVAPKKQHRGLLGQHDLIAHERYIASRPPRKFHLHVLTTTENIQTGTVAARAFPELIDVVRQRVKKPTAPVVVVAPSAYSLQGAQENGRDNDQCWFELRIGDSVTAVLWPLSMRFELHRSSDSMEIECSRVPGLELGPEPEWEDQIEAAQHEWSVPDKFQVLAGIKRARTKYCSGQPESVLWLNGLIEEYSRALESLDAPQCSFLQWATASSHAKHAVTRRFLRTCRADCRLPDPDVVPSAWECAATVDEDFDDAEVLQVFMQAIITGVFAPSTAPAMLRHEELSDVLQKALPIETSDVGHAAVAHQRADWLLEVVGSSSAEDMYQLGRDCAARSKPELTGTKDAHATAVGQFKEGTYVVLVGTAKDGRGCRWVHLQETINVKQFVDGDSQQLDRMQRNLRGWVRLPEHKPVPPHKPLLLKAALPAEMKVPYIKIDQISSLLAPELELATLMAWARQAPAHGRAWVARQGPTRPEHA